MNELIVKQTLDSREVAEMVDMEHKLLLRKIYGSKDRNGYITILSKNQMEPTKYFIESTYIDAQGKERKNCQITKIGCELIAHKITGEKGILFTARYVEKFHAMEEQLQKTTIELQIQELKELTTKAESLMKLSHKNKLDFNKFIKTLVETKEEVEAVKIYVLGMLACTKWQEVPVSEYPRVIELIKEVAPVVSTKKFKQMNFFDRKGE